MNINAKTLNELIANLEELRERVGGTVLCDVTDIYYCAGTRTVSVEVNDDEAQAAVDDRERDIRKLESEIDEKEGIVEELAERVRDLEQLVKELKAEAGA